MRFDDKENVDIERDIPNVRTVDLRHNKITFERQDPYGFWYAHLEMGALPEHLRGSYTSFEDAYQDVIRYMQDKKRTEEFKVPLKEYKVPKKFKDKDQ